MDEPQQERGLGLLPIGRDLAQIEYRAVNAGRFGLSLSTEIPTGTTAQCPHCGQERELRETRPNALGRSVRYWSECACLIAAAERVHALSVQATAAARGTRGDENADTADSYDVAALEQSGALTLAAFEPDRLADPSVYDDARRWLEDILACGVVGSYRSGPPAALYFQGLRGRGKTHLAIALMLSVHCRGHRVAVLNEKKFLWQTRTVPFGPPLEALVALPGDRAWLTVIDDIGKHRPESDADRVRVQNAWYNVLDRRYNCRRWTIFTSEKTIDELAAQGTIDDALYGRIYEMTRGVHLVFQGDDQRLAVS